ncbi:RHS repeat-associated core domain-containing protein [Mesonia oceanica]|uniref:Uncharacterized protein n=1 Tax=Mesonia oceanica TaxID=2687242 RepID=A0AC61YDF7_9FLAO|nr:RHS repeat-associated core domain-containing protein [Mesonia oceanica]VVV02552.1 hypothetical protein FVB9532_03852 [Mesonia oceanica]
MNTYAASYYDPKWSIWLSVDPMAEKYPGWSPYNYTLQNPIKYIDPTGMVVEGAEWKPKLCDDGSTTYIKEDNDNESTLRKQYELTSKEAKSLYSKMDSNGEISGNSVKEVTGNEDGILKLKDFSDTQHNLDQTIFAAQHSRSKGDGVFITSDYFNFEGKPLRTLKLDGSIDANGENIRVVSELLTHTVTGASVMGFSRSDKEIKYLPYAYEVTSATGIQYTQGTRMGRYGDIANYKLRSFIKFDGDLKRQSYINITTHSKDARSFRKYFEN